MSNNPIKHFLNKHSSLILSCVSIAGVVLTGFLSSKAMYNTMNDINKKEKTTNNGIDKKDIAKIAIPKYIPVILTGTSTIVCILGNYRINKNYRQSLIGAYALLETTLRDYKKKVIEVCGEETNDDIIQKIAIDKCDMTGACVPCYENLPINGEKMLFYDDSSDRYFESTIEAVQNAEYHLNRNFVLRGSVSLNDFYEFLGLDKTKNGKILGWSICKLEYEYGCSWIDFDHRVVKVSDDGLECCYIYMPIPPSIDYEDD